MKTITLRFATLSDTEMMFEWRNAEETRRYAFHTDPIDKDDHILWVKNTLNNRSRCLLIAEQEKEPLGVLRYDLSHQEAEASIYLRPGAQGKGYGTNILKLGTAWIKKNHPEIKILKAHVLIENIASQRSFEKAGYHAKAQLFEQQL